MVDGALIECGCQPQNVWIHLLETSEGVAVRLEDEEGVFMELPPSRKEPVEGHGPTNSGNDVEASDGGGRPGSEQERDPE